MSTPLRKSELSDGRVFVQIGTCGGTPEAASPVEALLSKKGIETNFHGSRAYAIEVQASDAAHAAELLRNDPQKEEHMITVYEV